MKGNVLVIGLGLIGGSVALAIRQEHKEAFITGFDVNEQNIALAKVLGIIDESCDSVEKEAAQADLIVIAIPVLKTAEMIKRLAAMPLKKDVLITDVGSTKERIVEASQVLAEQGIAFIGAHPMAGSHKSGTGAAKAHLFENAFYMLTPGENITAEQIETLKTWLKGTRAHFLEISPRVHDQLAGVISHFPHIIAAGLVNQARSSELDSELVSRLAAGGFRDITRIASSSPAMWRDILLQNQEVILSLMDSWQTEMEKIKSLIKERNSEGIYHFFDEARRFRDSLPSKSKGAIPAFYDLYVDVPDYPGVISEITGYLAEERISITNIRILETREEIYGVLVISFQTDNDRERAQDCLGRLTEYDTYLV
ncbi:prephenate dehydrogenase [Peribacillus saganii]|uniref:Prephenate dehydrogenase n=1 Tax=Peribacillus saganii TaxID=2303992 RepID=A0A372LMG8_9BACI|nr:prephenate dehydrogenase [Peribacillus saganii]RFU68491.1 prephenate dehydrogenase [Peribacillus saganii]